MPCLSIIPTRIYFDSNLIVFDCLQILVFPSYSRHCSNQSKYHQQHILPSSGDAKKTNGQQHRSNFRMSHHPHTSQSLQMRVAEMIQIRAFRWLNDRRSSNCLKSGIEACHQKLTIPETTKIKTNVCFSYNKIEFEHSFFF